MRFPLYKQCCILVTYLIEFIYYYQTDTEQLSHSRAFWSLPLTLDDHAVAAAANSHVLMATGFLADAILEYSTTYASRAFWRGSTNVARKGHEGNCRLQTTFLPRINLLDNFCCLHYLRLMYLQKDRMLQIGYKEKCLLAPLNAYASCGKNSYHTQSTQNHICRWSLY